MTFAPTFYLKIGRKQDFTYTLLHAYRTIKQPITSFSLRKHRHFFAKVVVRQFGCRKERDDHNSEQVPKHTKKHPEPCAGDGTRFGMFYSGQNGNDASDLCGSADQQQTQHQLERHEGRAFLPTCGQTPDDGNACKAHSPCLRLRSASC